jgi:O-antigen ligase
MQRLRGFDSKTIFLLFASFCLLILGAYFITQNILVLAIPFGIVAVVCTLLDIRYAYYILVLCLPISLNPVEQGGMSIDLPTELILILLTMLFPFIVLQNSTFFNKNYIKNPLVAIVILWVVWIGITSISSTNVMLSLKFFVAKVWYIIPLVFITSLIVFDRPKVFEKIFIIFLTISFVIIIQVLLNHKSLNFAFESVSAAGQPFFRNHVIYGSFVSLIFPIIFIACIHQKWFSKYWILLALAGITFLVAIYFSYSRGAWAAVFISFLSYVAIRLRLMPIAIISTYLLLVSAGFYLSRNNKFMDYAPKYETGIMHEDLTDHLLATIKGKDISSNERFYRWVAAVRMSTQKPIFGYGPNTFYENYKTHTVTLFRTYVSRNNEHSTTHNYFLFSLVEQGIPGMILYGAIIFILFSFGQKLYFRAKHNKYIQTIIMSVLCMESSFLLSNFLSELIEVDKLGGIFFIGMGILVGLDFYLKKSSESDFHKNQITSIA